MARTTQFPANCGIKIISALSALDTVEEQIKKLEKAFYFIQYKDSSPEPESAAVVLSDIDDAIEWEETKKFSKKLDAGTNPNSGNNLVVYVMTIDDFERMKKFYSRKKKVVKL